MGQIITFYSYKGGGGRSMALANVAWALASNGRRVLAVDWDLEAPGLHRYFHPFLADPSLTQTEGLLDHLWSYTLAAAGQDDVDPKEWADFSSVVTDLDLPKGLTGSLSFIGAGRQDNRYSGKVTGFDWRTFYQLLSGSALIDGFGDWARSNYDVVLIDSRTGVSDSSGICTVQLPSTVVLTFVYNRQSIEGTAAVARSIKAQSNARYQAIRIHPVPCRVEEKQAAASARRYAASQLLGVLGKDLDRVTLDLRLAEVRHHFWCAFEEKLAVFQEEPDERGSLLSDMHALASAIVGPVEPQRFDREELFRFWRRAAFSDPRLADLETLSAFAPSDAISMLSSWLADAAGDSFARKDWLETLARAAVAAPQMYGDTNRDACDAIAAQGISLARRVVSSGTDSGFDVDFARLLLARAGHLHERRADEEARALIEEAAVLLRDHHGPTSLVLARALEWQSGLMERNGNTEDRDALLASASSAYLRAATRDPRHYGDAARVLLKQGSERTAAKDQQGATASIEAARAILRQAERAGANVSPNTSIASLLAAARLAMAQEKVEEARGALKEAFELSPVLGDDRAATLLKDETLELWAEVLCASGEIERAREALASALVSRDLRGRTRLRLLAAEIEAKAGRQDAAAAAARNILAHAGSRELDGADLLRAIDLIGGDLPKEVRAAMAARAGVVVAPADPYSEEGPTNLGGGTL